jgi:ribosomal protein L37AE/L43A
MEVIYDEPESTISNANSVASIDLGLDNLVALTSNQPGFIPLLVNGRPLKSINQFYNKRKARLQSQLKRNRQTTPRIQRLTRCRHQKVDNYLGVAELGYDKFIVRAPKNNTSKNAELMQCPECQSTHVNKNGQKKGKQNYICVGCGRQFIDCYQPHKGYSEEVKRECLKMYVNGMGFRAIERIKGVHHTSIINWVSK